MDADDFAFEHWLKIQIDFIRKFSDYAAVSTRAVVIDKDSRIQRVLNTPLTEEDIILKSLIATPINHVGVLMNKELILKTGGYDENFRFAADFALWSKLIKRGFRLASTPDVGVAIRFHVQSTTMMEEGKSDVREVVRIMADNIEHWAGKKLNNEDAVSLWKLVYRAQELNVSQFLCAHKLLKEIYQAIDSSKGAAFKRTNLYFHGLSRIFYMKKIFAEIERGDAACVRQLARDYISHCGVFNFFSLIWMMTFLGLPGLTFFPELYKNIRLRSAKRMIVHNTSPCFTAYKNI